MGNKERIPQEYAEFWRVSCNLAEEDFKKQGQLGKLGKYDDKWAIATKHLIGMLQMYSSLHNDEQIQQLIDKLNGDK